MSVRTIITLCSFGLSLVAVPVTAAAASFEEELLIQINQYRLDNDLKPVTAWRAYDRLASEHSWAMRKANRLSHDGFRQRFSSARSTSCVENVGWNHLTPLSQFTGWRNSPGHNRSMLDPGITRAGIAKAGPYVTFFACN